MTPAPDADRLARSMLALLGHDDDRPADDRPAGDRPAGHRPADDRPAGHGQNAGTWSKANDFATEPERAAAIRETSARDRERYLTAGLTPVDCRFCHVTVAVKKLGPEHTAVQWSADATDRCATFAELRAAGGDSSRTRSCPRLSDSIRHAVAEGCLEEESTAPSPGDG